MGRSTAPECNRRLWDIEEERSFPASSTTSEGMSQRVLSAKAQLDSNAFDLSLQASTCGVCSRAPRLTLVLFFFLLPASYTSSSSSLSFFLPSFLEHSRPRLPSRLATWIPPAARACVHQQRRTPSSSQAPQHRHFSTKTLNLFWGACAKPGVSVLWKQAPQLRWCAARRLRLERRVCACAFVAAFVCARVYSAGEELRYAAVKRVPRW